MPRYEPHHLQPLFAAAAFAMTALTLFVAVGAPATLAPFAGEKTSIAAKAGGIGATEVTIIPSRIEVVGERETALADGRTRSRS